MSKIKSAGVDPYCELDDDYVSEFSNFPSVDCKIPTEEEQLTLKYKGASLDLYDF